MLPQVEARIREKYGVSLRRVSPCQYAVFCHGKPIGSVCRLYPSGWYFTNDSIKLPYVGFTRFDALVSYLDEVASND